MIELATHMGVHEGKNYLLKTKTRNEPIWRNRFEAWDNENKRWFPVPSATVKQIAIKVIE